MPDPAFAERLNEQIAHELAASQQYAAIAVHYDGETLPRLAAVFYAQALEERNHAMMMVQYLLDADAEPTRSFPASKHRGRRSATSSSRWPWHWSRSAA
jgi:ferritin